jgi:hypothetical protein
MTEEEADAAEADIMNLFDTGTDVGLLCRVCGSLVASMGEYPRAHWDWHEASNGAWPMSSGSGALPERLDLTLLDQLL